MKRAIVTPTVLAPSALTELKEWLAITSTQDDATLTALLRASIETCEAFTGVMPLATLCEEVLPVCRGWRALKTQPVKAILAVTEISETGVRATLPREVYAIDVTAGGDGFIQLTAPANVQRIAVTFTAGLAPAWNALPDGLRHGIMRLAAHHYRERDGGDADPSPPAFVVALWQPWRRLRVA